jgi:outer membrane protein insertion porin family
LSASINYEEVDISIDGESATPSELERFREEEGISVNRRFILQLERDSRPILNRFNPASGSYTIYRGEYVGGILGGDNDFVKLLWSWSKYNRLGTNAVLATRVRFGWVNEFGTSDDVPTKERFYLGGAYTIRGFPENEFGPQSEDGSAIGGEAIGLANVEIRQPIIYNFWGSIFVDAGFNEESLSSIKFTSPAVTTGFGIEYISPVGPLRIDYGQRTSVNGYRSGGQFHFGILYAF